MSLPYSMADFCTMWSCVTKGLLVYTCDDTFDMSQHATNLCSASFFQLHNVRRIGKYLTQEAAATLVHSFVTCRIDYCNSLLYGRLPDYQLAKLQRVQNSAARLVYRKSKFCHITPLLKKLHWLPINLRDLVQNSTFNVQDHKWLSSVIHNWSHLY